MKESQSAFSLAELVVVIGVVITLSAMSAVGVQTLTQKARALECANSLRQLGSAAMTYAADNDLRLPVTSHQRSSGVRSWTIVLSEYLGGPAVEGRSTGPAPAVYTCPADELNRTYSYTLNDFLTPNPSGAPDLDYSRLSTIATASRTFVFAEAARTYADTDHFHFATYRGVNVPSVVFQQQVAVTRHSGQANYFFADGHLECLSWERVQQLLADGSSSLVEPNRQ